MDGEEWRMHCELRRICKNEWERGGDWDREGRSKVEEEWMEGKQEKKWEQKQKGGKKDS